MTRVCSPEVIHRSITKRVEPLDVAFHSALSMTLDEWRTREDDEALSNLL